MNSELKCSGFGSEEYPRLGLIRVDVFDQALVDLRESMDRDIQSSGQK